MKENAFLFVKGLSGFRIISWFQTLDQTILFNMVTTLCFPLISGEGSLQVVSCYKPNSSSERETFAIQPQKGNVALNGISNSFGNSKINTWHSLVHVPWILTKDGLFPWHGFVLQKRSKA